MSDARELGTEIEEPGHPLRSTREHEIRVARTNFISLAGHSLAVNWKTGSRPNVSSRLSNSAERIESEPTVAL